MKTRGYSKNKMRWTTSQLLTIQFLWPLKVGHYLQKNDPKMTKNSQKQWKGYFSKFQYFICLHHLSQFLPQAIWLSTTWFLGNWESRIPGDFQVFQVCFFTKFQVIFPWQFSKSFCSKMPIWDLIVIGLILPFHLFLHEERWITFN